MMRVFAVSGFSGTGKTALVETIVSSLTKAGHSVATIKSSKHTQGPEQGTDTWKHIQAGASTTIFVGPNTKSTHLKDRLTPDELNELSKNDFLIIEGMKSADIPKFWCIGDKELIHDEIPVNTQAIVVWPDRVVTLEVDFPVLRSDDIKKLVEIIISNAIDFQKIE
jgi:molybdopterin-guanine dinucleotide biosynthesis protein MobB